MGIGNKLISLDGMRKAPQLYAALRNTVVTDITLQDVLDLVPLLQETDPDKVARYTLGIGQVTPYTIPSSGAAVLIPNSDAIKSILTQALSTP